MNINQHHIDTSTSTKADRQYSGGSVTTSQCGGGDSPSQSCGMSISASVSGPCQHPPPTTQHRPFVDATSTSSSFSHVQHRTQYNHHHDGIMHNSAMKAMLVLLSPKAQASCRSTCTSFAIAFTDLIDDRAISLSATTLISNAAVAVVSVIDVDAKGSPESSSLMDIRSKDFTSEYPSTPPPPPPLPSSCKEGDDNSTPPVCNITATATTTSVVTSPLLSLLNVCDGNRGDSDDDDGEVKEVRVNLLDDSYDEESTLALTPTSPPYHHHHHTHQFTEFAALSSPACAIGTMYSPRRIHHLLSRGREPSSTTMSSSSLFVLRPPSKWLKWAPASLSSPHLHNQHVVVNIEVLALQATSLSVGYTIKPSPIPRVKYLYVHILDNLCANLVAKSIEFIGMSKVCTIGNNLLRKSEIESVTYGDLPRLKSIGNEWMAGCIHLRHVHFVEPLPKLKVVRHGWMRGCRALQSIDLTPFPTVEHVGDNWLSQCNALHYANFTPMPFLVSVGDFWLYGAVSLRRVSFADMAYLVRIGASWLARCCVLEEASFVNMQSLQSIGDGFAIGTPLP